MFLHIARCDCRYCLVIIMRTRVTYVSLLAGFACLFSLSLRADEATAISQLQQGYGECKKASLIQRKDFEQAQQHFNAFLTARDEAIASSPDILVEGNPEAIRILDYCDTVGTNLARSEALPLFQQGSAACSSAAELVRRGQLESASQSFDTYLDLKEQAVTISPAILEVYSVGSDIRRCDRVLDDMTLAQIQQSELEGQISSILDYHGETNKQCSAFTADSVTSEVEKQEISETASGEQTELDLAKGMSEEQGAELENELNRIRNAHQALVVRHESAPVIENVGQRDLSPIAPFKSLQEMAVAVNKCLQASASRLSGQEKVWLAYQEEQKRKAELLAEQMAERLAGDAGSAIGVDETQAAELTEEEKEALRLEQLAKNSENYKLIKRVSPVFPKRALEREQSGYVVVEFKINTEGEVIDPVIVESEPGRVFDNAAIKAVKKWQYEPDFGTQDPSIAMTRTRMSFAIAGSP